MHLLLLCVFLLAFHMYWWVADIGPGMHREDIVVQANAYPPCACALAPHPLGLSDRGDATRERAPFLCATHVLPSHAGLVTKFSS